MNINLIENHRYHLLIGLTVVILLVVKTLLILFLVFNIYIPPKG